MKKTFLIKLLSFSLLLFLILPQSISFAEPTIETEAESVILVEAQDFGFKPNTSLREGL